MESKKVLIHASIDPVVLEKVRPYLTDIQVTDDGDIFGMIEEVRATEKRTGTVENAREHVSWVEYWVRGEKDLFLVHRSAHTTLLQPVTASGAEGSVNG